MRVVPLPLFYILFVLCHGRQGQGVTGSELSPCSLSDPLHQMTTSGEGGHKTKWDTGASISRIEGQPSQADGTYGLTEAYRAHHLPGVSGRRCGGNSFPIYWSTIRRTDLVLIVRLVRTFSKKQSLPV